LAQALKTTAVARVGGLSGLPAKCDDKTGPLGAAVGGDVTADTKDRTECAKGLAADGGYASTLLATKLVGADYVVSGTACTASDAGKLVVVDSGSVLACPATGTNVMETASFGAEW
jgi:hypothetical protein